MKYNYIDIEKLRNHFLDVADKDYYEEPISNQDKELLEKFSELNMKRSTKGNIDSFFDIVVELLNYKMEGESDGASV